MTTINLDDDMRATLRKLRLSTFADIFFDLAAADDANTALPEEIFLKAVGPDPRKVDTSGVSYAAWVSVADVSASKSLGARRLHQECRLRVL